MQPESYVKVNYYFYLYVYLEFKSASWKYLLQFRPTKLLLNENRHFSLKHDYLNSKTQSSFGNSNINQALKWIIRFVHKFLCCSLFWNKIFKPDKDFITVPIKIKGTPLIIKTGLENIGKDLKCIRNTAMINNFLSICFKVDIKWNCFINSKRFLTSMKKWQFLR